MKDRFKKVASWLGLALVSAVGVGMGYKAFFGGNDNNKAGPQIDPTQVPVAENLDASVAGGSEDVIPTQTPVAVVVSTNPPLDSSGLPYKGNESCRIVATTGEVFYISLGRPSMMQGHVCLGRDGSGLNWWLANEVKLGGDINGDGQIATALVSTSN